MRVAPHRLVITGKWRTIREEKTRVEKGSDEALHEVDLSEAIDPDEVTATVQNGTHEIQMKKARPSKNILHSVEAE